MEYLAATIGFSRLSIRNHMGIRSIAVEMFIIHILFDQLFGVGALAHRGLSPFTGGLCGDYSPHRTTMTQTKCCSIFAFWVMVVVCEEGHEQGDEQVGPYLWMRKWRCCTFFLVGFEET